MAQPFRLAHLSDLHFSEVDFDLRQFFSKRWIGNLNYLLRRRKDFDDKLLKDFPSLLQKLKVDVVLISGDLSCTSSKKEFEKAFSFIESLKNA